MAQNILPKTLPPLFHLAEAIAAGLDAHQDVRGIKQNRSEAVRADLATARGADGRFAEARSVRSRLIRAAAESQEAAKLFLATARDVLKRRLGARWTPAWHEAGFVTGSLMVARRPEARMGHVHEFGSYFAAHPEHALPALELTAAHALALHERLSDARSAVHAHRTALVNERHARDQAVARLRLRLRGTIDELAQLLDAHDPCWRAFALQPPGAAQTPPTPTQLALTAGPRGSGQLHLRWAGARRAARYRVWRQLPDDPTPLPVATVHDAHALLEAQPLGPLIKIVISALNDGGESPASPAQEITIA